jgi:hypothetical protein
MKPERTMTADKITAELMAQIDELCGLYVVSLRKRAEIEQAIRRAVDWGEPVAYVPRCIKDGQYEVDGEFRFKEIDEEPFECWNVEHWTCEPLYARSAKP